MISPAILHRQEFWLPTLKQKIGQKWAAMERWGRLTENVTKGLDELDFKMSNTTVSFS